MYGHDSWLVIAKEDLFAAQTLLKAELFSTATYHCHQAAEKTLKGYLAFRKQEITKTHDLVKLLGLCIKLDKDFEKLYDFAEALSPFATKFRYPSEYDIPDFVDVEVAIKQAQKTLSFVIQKIAAPDTGQIEMF